MRRVNDPPRDDPELLPAIRPDPGREPPRGGEASDRTDQLGLLVGHEPGIQPPLGLRARPPVQHDPVAAMLDQQARRCMTGGGHGPDAEQCDPHYDAAPPPGD
jgi:hypothetical protein